MVPAVSDSAVGAGAFDEGLKGKRKISGEDATRLNGANIDETNETNETTKTLKKEVSFKLDSSTTGNRYKRSSSKDFPCGGIGIGDEDEESDEEEDNAVKDVADLLEHAGPSPSLLGKVGSIIFADAPVDDDFPEIKSLRSKRGEKSISQVLEDYSTHLGTGICLVEKDNESDSSESEEEPRPLEKHKSISEYLEDVSHRFGTGDCFDTDSEDPDDDTKSPERKRLKKSHSISEYVSTPLCRPSKKIRKI